MCKHIFTTEFTEYTERKKQKKTLCSPCLSFSVVKVWVIYYIIIEIPMREEQLVKTLFQKTLRQITQPRVKKIQIILGELAELDCSIIEIQWKELSLGTPLEHAQIAFRLIEGEVQCMACFKKYQPVHGKIHCPHCGSYGAKILSGEEFYVEHIEMDE